MKTSFLVFILSLIAGEVSAQYDSSYYAAYPSRITGRVYFSNKYTTFKFKNVKENYTLRYQPNTSINIGVGATYRNATLNLGVGILNRNPSKGRTRYLDLQFHNYGRKFTLDLLGQFYHGFYLFPKGSGNSDGQFYKRPDLRVNEIGGTFQYVVNNKKFSYRASFLQNEWQKRSAGTFLIGFETYYGRITADSSIVPSLVNKSDHEENIRTIKFFEAGPNAGYAYTQVFHRHYFLTGAGTVSLDYGSNSIENGSGKIRSVGFSPNTMIRFCAGYNSSLWAFSIHYINNGVQGGLNNSIHELALNTGNIRVILVKRFIPTVKQKKVLKVVP